MSEAVIAKAIADLLPYADKDGIVEIVMRGAKKRFRAFQKVALADLEQGEMKELMEKAIQALNQGEEHSAKNMAILQNVAQMQNLGLVLNGLNLCATCAGFAVMYAKLEKMSNEIASEINALEDTVKRGYDVQSGYEYKKVLGEYQNMLDCRRIQRPYPEDKMRELVDQEYVVISLLIELLQYDLASNKRIVIEAIFSMLAMLTVSLRYFDEQYYFNNHEVLGDSEVWHSSHAKWMGVYDHLSSDWFAELLQDYALFELGFSTIEVDAYYTALTEQVSDLRQEVVDNQILIITVADPELLRIVHEVTTQNVRETITAAIDAAFAGMDVETTERVRRKALEQVAAM